MRETGGKTTQSSWGCLAMGIVFPLVFLFQGLLGHVTSSTIANALIVMAATILASGIVAFGVGVSFAIFRVYRALRVHLRYAIPLPIELVPADDLPPEVGLQVRDFAAALAPLGYKLSGCLHFIFAKVPGHVALAHHDRAGTIARCILSPQRTQLERYLVFRTRVSDGTEYATSHLSRREFSLIRHAPAPNRSALVFFDIEDLSRLARLHEAAVERSASARVDTGTIDPLKFHAETVANEMATQVDAGYLRLRGDEYRTTRRGAFRMALKSLRPITALRVRSADRKAARFLAETGL
jgi:hypothetical protein